MQKYAFSLQPVLKVKKIREKEAQRELGLAINVFQQGEGKLGIINQDEKQAQEKIEKLKMERFDPAAISQYYNSLDGIRSERIEQEIYLTTCAKLVKEKREKLRAVSNEKKVFEELEKREHVEYVRESNRLEQKFFDEMSTIKQFQKKDSNA
jgi:flagellar protein FliJ